MVPSNAHPPSRVSFLGGFAAAAGSLALGAPAGAQAVPAITIASSTFDSATAGYFAVMSGMFKRAGLDVTFEASTPAAIPSAIIGGAVQIAASNLFSIVEAYARKIPFTVVAPGALFDATDEDGYVGLVVRKDGPLRTGRDFAGKTVGVPAIKDFNSLAVMSWIDQTGGDSSTVRLVEMPAPAAGAAVVAGRIDATILTVPFLERATAGGDLRVLTDAYSAIGKSYLGLGWIATAAYAAAHPDVCETFARVIHQSSVFVNAHHDDTVELMAQLAKVDPAAIRNQRRVTFATIATPAMVQPVIDVSYKYKVIDHRFDAAEMLSPSAMKRYQ